MIDFKHLELTDKPLLDQYLMYCGERGCEYSFSNLYLWGRQRAALLDGFLVFFSQFNRKSVYPFPVGSGQIKPVLDAIIQDAQERDIPCRLTSLTEADCETLEQLYPGRFRFHFDRDGYDYIYDINDLADLPGKKYQKKRNHVNRFLQRFPNWSVQPVSRENLPLAEQLLRRWYEDRLQQSPTEDLHMEKAALRKALVHQTELGMEGLLLLSDDQPVAFTLGSVLSDSTFDIHFEKALDGIDGAYAMINREFARHLRQRHPNLLWLNREDDLGSEGLRKAKLSYYPHHLVEKRWACLLEDGYDY